MTTTLTRQDCLALPYTASSEEKAGMLADAIVAARTAQEEAERYEARRLAWLAWLAAYEPDVALCAAEADA